MEKSVVVLQDNKEQIPWDFSFYGIEQRPTSLKTGDYTLLGYEDKLCIERKRTTGEIAINFGSKSKAFFAEVERMKEFEHRYIIFEFSEDILNEFPKRSGIPTKIHGKLRVSANFLISCVDRIRNDYGVEVIFAGDRDTAIQEAINIFDRVINETGRPVF